MVRARRFMALSAVVAFFALAASASADTVQVTTNQDTLGGVDGCPLRAAAAIMALAPPRPPVNPLSPACAPVTAAGTDTITFAPSLSGQTITLGSAGEIPLSDPASA